MRYKYTKKELTIIKNSLVILVDTKEQNNSHVTDFFEAKKIKYKKMNLKQGDYSLMLEAIPELGIARDIYFDKDFVIERKNSIDEVCGNFTDDKGSRISKEFADLKANNTKCYFFIENKNITEALRNCSPYKALSFKEQEKIFEVINDLDLRPNNDHDLRQHRYRSEYSPNSFNLRLKRFIARYNLFFRSVYKEHMGSEIKETLEAEFREYLEYKGIVIIE